MKKLYVLLLLVLLGLNIHAQKPMREMVIAEGALGFWTTYCAGAALGADHLIANEHDVAIIINHHQDSLENSYSIARNNFYGVQVIPTFYFDGILSVPGGSSTNSMYSSYVDKVYERLSVASDFTMAIQLEESGNSYTADVGIKNQWGNFSQDLVLQFAITESKLQIDWGLSEEQNFVNRLMLPDANGTPLDFTTTDTLTISYEFTPDPFWNTDYCEIVAFIQDTATKEVLQGTKRILVVPDFNVDVEAKRVKYPYNEHCGNFIRPVVYIENRGANPLTSVDISATINGGSAVDTTWTGDLSFNQGENVTLPLMEFTHQPLNDFEFTLTNPNGVPDQFPDNNSLSKQFAEAAQVATCTVYVNVKTDNFPEEVSWQILDSEGITHYTSSDYTGMPDSLFTDTIVLHGTDCYTFEIFDSWGDGLCCVYGDGYYELLDADSNVMLTGAEYQWNEIRPFERVDENCLVADFIVDDTLKVEGDSAYFTDLSLGTISGWNWSFEGADPDTSNLQHPVVAYNDTGYYSVTLTIYDDVNSVSVTKEDYIYVENNTVGLFAEKHDELLLFPNPSTGIVKINGAEDASIIVYNNIGSIVRSIENLKGSSIDLSQLERGIYYISIGLKDGRVVNRKLSLIR